MFETPPDSLKPPFLGIAETMNKQCRKIAHLGFFVVERSLDKEARAAKRQKKPFAESRVYREVENICEFAGIHAYESAKEAAKLFKGKHSLRASHCAADGAISKVKLLKVSKVERIFA